jgi:cell division protein FtsL
MSIDVEYAIKKDVRNNPIVRGVDEKQRRALMRTLAIGVLVVGMLLFSGWQRYQMMDHGYTTERLTKEIAAQEAANRRLQLEVDTLESPSMIESRAIRELHMAYPTPAETVLVERVPATTAPKSVVASAR